MRRVLAIALVVTLGFPVSSVFAAGAGLAQTAGSISGTAHGAGGRVAANATVQLRDVASGQLAGTATTDAAGQFSFTSLNAGNYVVEVVDAAGKVVGTSAPIAVSAGAVAGINVTAASALAGGSVGSFFGSPLGLLTVAAVGAGVTGVTIAANRDTTSPSK